MKKSTKVVLFLVLVLILFNIFIYFYLNDFQLPFNKKNLKEDPEVIKCFNEDDSWDCLILLGLKEDNLEYCDLIEENFKSRCLTTFAIMRNDSKLCEETSGRDCSLYLALINKDISLCGKDDGSRYSKEDCIETIKENYDKCEGSMIEPCFFAALYGNSIELCYELNKSHEYRVLCLTTLMGDVEGCQNSFSSLAKNLAEEEGSEIPEEELESVMIYCEALGKRNSTICEGIYDCNSMNPLIFKAEVGELRKEHLK